MSISRLMRPRNSLRSTKHMRLLAIVKSDEFTMPQECQVMTSKMQTNKDKGSASIHLASHSQPLESQGRSQKKPRVSKKYWRSSSSSSTCRRLQPIRRHNPQQRKQKEGLSRAEMCRWKSRSVLRSRPLAAVKKSSLWEMKTVRRAREAELSL